MKRQHSNRGFSLVELLLVVVIIGILAGAVTVGLRGRSSDARKARAKADMSSTLALAIDMFEQDTGRYPSSDEGLSVLINNDDEISGWNGPYIQGGTDGLLDPWGVSYHYSYIYESGSANHYLLRCYGPDSTAEGGDDIVVYK